MPMNSINIYLVKYCLHSASDWKPVSFRSHFVMEFIIAIRVRANISRGGAQRCTMYMHGSGPSMGWDGSRNVDLVNFYQMSV